MTSAPASITMAEAAVLLASGRGVTGERLQQAVESQLTRRGVVGSDRDDVRADVAYALLLSPRDDRLALDAACALVGGIARNKAIDQHRRRRRETPASAAVLIERALASDHDAVSAEVHRRDVSRALRQLVGELPSSERRALTATATGAGFAGSGLGRSSHYRALDRARLRLTAAVRSRIAGGLALPVVLLRRLGSGRGILAPVSVAVAAGIASVALVLPATELSTPAYARATLSVGADHPAASVAARGSTPPPPRLTRRRVRIRAAAPAAPHRSAPRHVSRPIATRAPSPTPAAGLGPCRAARLCQ
jgi:hypothetical protein